MKTCLIFLLLFFSVVSFANSVYSAELQRNSLAELNKAYNMAIDNLAKKVGILASGADHFVAALYSNDPLLLRFREEVAVSTTNINDARSKGVSDEEMSRLLLAYQQAKLRENKQLMAIAESSLYSSMDYALAEGLKGSIETAHKVISDFLANWKTILEPILKGDFKGVFKNAILQLIDSTYKITFIDYVKSNYGATDKIATFWWKSYFVDPFSISEEKKFMDEILTSASDELKEKLKEKLTERVKLEILKKGEALTEEAIEGMVKEKAEGILKNIVETPSLVVELFAKYYNVVYFQLMFNRLAVNEVAFLKEIRRVVGNDSSEIDKCYFDKAYFLATRRAKNAGKTDPVTEKMKDSKIEESDRNILPGEVLNKVAEAVEKEDPFIELTVVQTIEAEIIEMTSRFTADSIPSSDRSVALIEELFDRLKADEITLVLFNQETYCVSAQYDAACARAVANLKSEIDSQKEKGQISESEYIDRNEEIEREASKQKEELSSTIAGFREEIENARFKFREEFYTLFHSVDLEEEVIRINSEMTDEIRGFLQVYLQKTGIHPGNTYFPSFNDLSTAFSDQENGFGNDFFKRLRSDSPEIVLLQSGWILEGLYAIWTKERELTNDLLDRVGEIDRELDELFISVPKFHYSDGSGLHEFSREVSAFDSYRIDLLKRNHSLQENGSSLSDWSYLLDEKNSKTYKYLEAYLVLQREKLEIFRTLSAIVTSDFIELEEKYLENWTERIQSMVQTIAGLWSEEITIDRAQYKLREAAAITHSVDELYAYWVELRDELFLLKREMEYIQRHGVPSLDISSESSEGELLRDLISRNEELKLVASLRISDFESADPEDARYDLKSRVEAFTEMILDCENHPDNTIAGSPAYNIRYTIKNTSIQKSQISFPLTLDNPLVMGLAAGDLNSSLGLCEEFMDFMERVEKRKAASEAAEEYLNQRLDSIEASLARIESEGTFVTAEGKKELIDSLDKAVEEATEVFRSYGFMYTRWSNQRELQLRDRVDNLVMKKEIDSSHFKTHSEEFSIVERPANLIRGELIWLDVTSNGYPSQRFELSADRNRLMIEMRPGSDPSTRFRMLDLSTGEFEIFPLPAEALEIVSTERYRFDWDSDGRLLIYSYAGNGIVIGASGDFEEFSYNAIEGTEFFDNDYSGRYGLFREPRGQLYVLDNEVQSRMLIGITYSTYTLQWLQGEGTVFFVDENNEIELFSTSNETASKPGTVFSASSCAVLPGGEWLVYGDAFELKAMRLDGSEAFRLLEVSESSEILIAGTFPLQGNSFLLLWMKHGEEFDYAVQVCSTY